MKNFWKSGGLIRRRRIVVERNGQVITVFREKYLLEDYTDIFGDDKMEKVIFSASYYTQNTIAIPNLMVFQLLVE